MPPYFWLTFLLLLVVAASFVRLARGLPRIRELRDQPADLPTPAPRVSIVFSALNEAPTIEPALRSLLALDYPALEVIAINDRSTDGTGAILDRLAATDARLRVIHIDALPAGWLGKSHALHRGAQVASGDYLLFTDADVVLAPPSLAQGVAFCERERVDHLTILADFVVRGPLMAILMLNFYSFVCTAHTPWRLRRSRKVYCGIAWYNLVRTAAYRASGGHEAIKLNVLDDLALGKIVKRAGFTQDALFGMGAVKLAWYASFGEMVRGLEKNSFAVVDYSLPRLVIYTALLLLVTYWPIAALFLTQGVVWWLALATVGLNVAYYELLRRRTGWSRLCLLLAPVAPLAQIYMNWRGVLLMLWRGGIDWRGTHYALDDLRRAHRG